MEKNSYIRFDWVIRRLLRNRADFSVVEGLLTVLFEEKIKIVEVLESKRDWQWRDEKYDHIELKAKNSKDEFIFVEVQNLRLLHYYERILWGPPEPVSPVGYMEEAKKIYSVCILYFDIGKGDDYVYHGQNRFIGIHTNDELLITTKEEGAMVQKLPSEIFPEYYLIRVNEFNQVAKTPLEEWVQYLKTGVIDPDTTAPGLPEAREKLRYYDMSPEERRAYDEHMNAIMIQNDVLSTAKLEGCIEANRATAKNLKNLGVSDDIISQATGLGLEEIAKL